MPKRYTNEKLISELHRFVRENNRVPTAPEMNKKNGYPSYLTYINHFGSWNSALIVVGFEINVIHNKLTGSETCCKCSCTREQTANWYTKGLQKGQVMCKNCYQNSFSDYKRGNLDKNSAVGKGTISQRVVANVLGLNLKHDCNCSDNFGHPFDLYDEDRYKYINVKDSKLHSRVEHMPFWYFRLIQKEIPDTYIMLGYDKDRKNILKVWITDAIDDLVFDEEKMEYKKSLNISDTYESLKEAEPWEVDAKPYNDMLHKMSQKRKDNNGDDCFLRNDDLNS